MTTRRSVRTVPMDMTVPPAVQRRPENELEALMEAAPADTPTESLEEASELRGAIADALDMLSPQDRFIIEAVDYEGLSAASLGERLNVSSTQAQRLHAAALDRLRMAMLDSSTIRSRVGEARTFNSEVYRLLRGMSPPSERNAPTHRYATDADALDLLVALLGTHDPVKVYHQLGSWAVEMLEVRGSWNAVRMGKTIVALARRLNGMGRWGSSSPASLAAASLVDFDELTLRREQSKALKRIVFAAVTGLMIHENTYDLPMESAG